MAFKEAVKQKFSRLEDSASSPISLNSNRGCQSSACSSEARPVSAQAAALPRQGHACWRSGSSV